LKWIAGFFVPGGAFVKIVKAIVRAFQFVADNLDNLKHFFDSVFDSMEAAVQGSTAGVVSKIIAGLKMGVVLALDFLAKQLGLSKIVNDVQRMIQSLRNPIVKAIEWVLTKAKPFVMKVMSKGKALWETGKEKVIGVGKEAIGAVLGFFGVRKHFSDDKGEKHSLYFEQRRGEPVLLIESTPQHIEKFLMFYINEYKSNAVKEQILSQIMSYLETYEADYAALKKVGLGSKQAKSIQERLLDKNASLTGLLRTLLSGNRKVGLEIESYLLEGLTGTYSSMPRPPSDILTADHQPQAAILKWSADLKIGGHKLFSSKSEMGRRADGAHASGGYAINLHKYRHEKGRTFGSEGDKTKKAFINFIEPKIAKTSDEQKLRDIIVERMKEELEWDVERMRVVLEMDKVRGDKVWGDIDDEITVLNKAEKRDLKKSIKARIKDGLRQIENQPMDVLKKG
jgi:hypothetical protein